MPTKKGMCLRLLEYNSLKQPLPEIGNILPELNAVVPCFLQSDHMNQLGTLQCSECNPNDFHNWLNTNISNRRAINRTTNQQRENPYT